VRNPAINAAVPKLSGTWVSHPTALENGIVAPATTGSICISAPIITMARKPSVSAWVSASACGVQREARVSGARTIRMAAARRNSGAVRKNRSGSANGGACSKERPACWLIAATSRQPLLRALTRPGGSG
jgi:hypothetical protein